MKWNETKRKTEKSGAWKKLWKEEVQKGQKIRSLKQQAKNGNNLNENGLLHASK